MLEEHACIVHFEKLGRDDTPSLHWSSVALVRVVLSIWPHHRYSVRLFGNLFTNLGSSYSEVSSNELLVTLLGRLYFLPTLLSNILCSSLPSH